MFKLSYFSNIITQIYYMVYFHNNWSLNIMDTFRVYTRCRPLNEYQQNFGANRKAVKILDECTLSLNDGISKQHTFQLDGIFDQTTENIHIFNSAIVPAIDNVVNGINSTVFAYGITGAGKSFTMFGKSPTLTPTPVLTQHLGIIPLTFHHLFNILDAETKLRMSYLEIYNEQVFDLLQETQHNLQLSEDPIQGCVIVQDLRQIQLSSQEQVEQLISIGNSRRVIAETKANEVSSRSHAIVIVNIQRKVDADRYLSAKLSLVDLAGSERQSVHSQTRGIRTFEGSNINRSLLTLGNCINILSQKRRPNSNVAPQFIPYRDSKLTRLLKDSLGGNTKTVMIACISPSSLYYDETLNTLKYACRANKIQKIVHQNIRDIKSTEEYKKQIAALKKQNQMLKMNLNMSLMLPGLSVGIAQQEARVKKTRVAEVLDKLVKNVEDRVVIMAMNGSDDKIQTIQKLVRVEQELKSSILEQFQHKPIKKTQNKIENSQISQKKKTVQPKEVTNIPKQSTSQKIPSSRVSFQKPKQVVNQPYSSNMYKLSLKQLDKNCQEELNQQNTDHHDYRKNKSRINLQNLRKKIMEDKKQLSNFKKEILEGLLTVDQIQAKAQNLLDMAGMSVLRFSDQQTKYLRKLVHGEVESILKQNFQSTNKKILNLASYSQGNQPNSMILNISEHNGVENSRSRHLKSLNRIISLARVRSAQSNQHQFKPFCSQDVQGYKFNQQSHYISNVSIREEEADMHESKVSGYYEDNGEYQQAYEQSSENYKNYDIYNLNYNENYAQEYYGQPQTDQENSALNSYVSSRFYTEKQQMEENQQNGEYDVYQYENQHTAINYY